MARLADVAAATCLLILLALVGLGVFMQLELMEPGIQIFYTPDEAAVGWTLYPPLDAGKPNGNWFSNIRTLHIGLTVLLVFALALLASVLLQNRRLIVLSLSLAALWMIGCGVVFGSLFSDRNFGTEFFSPDGSSASAVSLWILDWLLRINVWNVIASIPPLGPVPIAERDLVLEITALVAVAAPVLGLLCLSICLIRITGLQGRSAAITAIILALLSTLVPNLGPLMSGTQVEVALSHFGLGALGIFATGYLLVGWLELQGRSLPVGVTLGCAMIAAGLLAVSALVSLLLGRQGMPTGYLDYPEYFAGLYYSLSLVNFALGATVAVFLIATVLCRLGPVKADRTSDTFT